MTEQRLDLLAITTNPVDDLLTRILYNCEIVSNLTYAVAGTDLPGYRKLSLSLN